MLCICLIPIVEIKKSVPESPDKKENITILYLQLTV